jgi:hypothetical protein
MTNWIWSAGKGSVEDDFWDIAENTQGTPAWGGSHGFFGNAGFEVYGAIPERKEAAGYYLPELRRDLGQVEGGGVQGRFGRPS